MTLGSCSVETTSPAPQPSTASAPTTRTTTRSIAPHHWYAAGWPAAHHDSSNSDTSPAPAFDHFELAFHALDGWRTIAIPAVANGTVYLTVVDQRGGSDCHLAALDPATGEMKWCSDAVNGTSFGSTAVVDADGNLYVGDDTAMVSLTPEGRQRWRTPVDGLPISAVLTGDGSLLFSTHIGRVSVLDRRSGNELTSRELVPGLTYDGSWAALLGCPQGRARDQCPSANTPAVDAASSRVFLTLNRPGEADGTLLALQLYGGENPRLEPLWDTRVLEKGGAGTPTISPDGTRVYTTDGTGKLYCFDAITGAVIWTQPMGYTAGGSPSVNAHGMIVPAGGRSPAHLIGIRDDGDHATTVWEHPELIHRGLAVMPDADVAYVALVEGATVRLAVIDLQSGEIRGQASTGDGLWASMGTGIGPDGNVYLTTPLNGIYAFAPSDSAAP